MTSKRCKILIICVLVGTTFSLEGEHIVNKNPSKETKIGGDRFCVKENDAAVFFALITNYSTQSPVKMTQYDVCHRPFTRYQFRLVGKLKKMRIKGLRRYLRKHQQCKLRGTKRRHLELTTLQSLPPGSTYKLVNCIPKRHLEGTNTLSMCHVCNYDVTLSERFIPRYHRFVKCGKNSDNSCFMGEGVCAMKVAYVPVLFDLNQVGPQRLSEWPQFQLGFAKSCSCEIIKGSLFERFV